MSGFQYPPTELGGQPNGYATLDSGGKVPTAQLPLSVFAGEGQVNPLLSIGA